MKFTKIISILILSFVTGLIYFNPNLEIAEDNARYIIVAKSLLNGTGYKITSFPEPLYETMHPFGYSSILALIMAIFGENLFFLKLFSLLCFVLSIWLAFKFFSEDINLKNLIFLILIMSFSPIIAQYSSQVSTEIPYLCISLLCLYMFKRYSIDKKYFLPLLASLILAFYIRAQGLLLTGAIIFYYLVARQFKKALSWGIIAILIIGPWILWTKVHRLSGFTDYTSTFFLKSLYDPEMGNETILGICFRIYRRIKFYVLAAIPVAIFPSLGPEISLYNPGYQKMILGILIFAAGAAGFVKKFILKRNILEFYFLGYCLVISVWSWMEARFLVTILPIILFYFIFGLESLFKYKKGIMAAVIIILIIFSNVLGNVKMYKGIKEYPPQYWKGCSEITKWVKENTQKENIICCRKPWVFNYFTGRKTLYYKFTKDTDKILNSLEGEKVDFILLNFNDGLDIKYLKPLIEKYPERFELIFRSREAFLYKFR